MKNTMKLKEAVRFLRRYQDWRCGFDERTMDDSIGGECDDSKMSTQLTISSSIDKILAHFKFEIPFIVCEKCSHFDIDNGMCKMNVKGECTQYESIDDNCDGNDIDEKLKK